MSTRRGNLRASDIAVREPSSRLTLVWPHRIWGDCLCRNSPEFCFRHGTIEPGALGLKHSIHLGLGRISIQARVYLFKHLAHSVKVGLQFSGCQFGHASFQCRKTMRPPDRPKRRPSFRTGRGIQEPGRQSCVTLRVGELPECHSSKLRPPRPIRRETGRGSNGKPAPKIKTTIDDEKRDRDQSSRPVPSSIYAISPMHSPNDPGGAIAGYLLLRILGGSQAIRK